MDQRVKEQEARDVADHLVDEMTALRDRIIELEEVVDAVIKWAETPGDHGGNPYSHKMVRLAMKARE